MSNRYVYILASRRNGTLYVGVTNDLLRRVDEHKKDLVEGFTRKYAVHTLVYFEICQDHASALQREKQIKKWKRQWKIRLIEKGNPEWKTFLSRLYPLPEKRSLDSCLRRNGSMCAEKMTSIVDNFTASFMTL